MIEINLVTPKLRRMINIITKRFIKTYSLIVD